MMEKDFSALARFQGSPDEQLARAIANHFINGALFPAHPEFSRFGFQKKPPTPFAQAWILEDDEVWLAHALCAYYLGFENGREFKTAGAAAILVTNKAVLLKLGVGGPSVSGAQKIINTQKENLDSRLEQQRLRFIEIQEVGGGDLLRLRGWRNDEYKHGLIFRLDWPRSFAALILGLQSIAKNPKALMDANINADLMDANINAESKNKAPKKLALKQGNKKS